VIMEHCHSVVDPTLMEELSLSGSKKKKKDHTW